jgi:hypothetical protein
LFGRRKDSSKQKSAIPPPVEPSATVEELPKQQPLLADEVAVIEEATPTAEQSAVAEELVKSEEELTKVEGWFLVTSSTPGEGF